MRHINITLNINSILAQIIFTEAFAKSYVQRESFDRRIYSIDFPYSNFTSRNSESFDNWSVINEEKLKFNLHQVMYLCRKLSQTFVRIPLVKGNSFICWWKLTNLFKFKAKKEFFLIKYVFENDSFSHENGSIVGAIQSNLHQNLITCFKRKVFNEIAHILMNKFNFLIIKSSTSW